MANTYTLIDKVILGSSQSSVEFTSINQSYTNLLLKLSVRDNASAVGNNILFKINSGTTSQSIRFISGDGSSTPNSANDTPIYFTSNGNTSTSSTFSNMEIYIHNYASTSLHKSLSVDSVSENNGTLAYAQLVAGLYASNTQITSILFNANGGVNFLTGSSFYLYGIKNS